MVFGLMRCTPSWIPRHFISSKICLAKSRPYLRKLGKHFVLIAESDLNDPRIVTSREAGGYGIDAQWCDEFHHALHAVLTGEQKGYYEDFGSFEHLAKAMENGLCLRWRLLQTSRPLLRPESRSNLSGHHFVVFTQNHDQVGNRAQGERLSHLVNLGRQKIAAALMLTSPFIPMLFMGEEYSASTPFQYFTQHEDEELAPASLRRPEKRIQSFRLEAGRSAGPAGRADVSPLQAELE